MVFLSMKYQIKNRKTKQNTLHEHADYLQNWINQSVCPFLMIDNGSGKPKLVLLSKFVLPWKKINYDTQTLIFMSRKAQHI